MVEHQYVRLPTWMQLSDGGEPATSATAIHMPARGERPEHWRVMMVTCTGDAATAEGMLRALMAARDAYLATLADKEQEK